MLGGKGWEEQGSWDTRLNPPWKPKPSLGRPGLNLSGCQHLKGEEEEEGEEEVEALLSKKVQVGAISQLFEL